MDKWEEEFEKGNIETAQKLLIEGVENQDTTAMYSYGLYLLSGEFGFERNVKKGEEVLLGLSKINGNNYSDLIGMAYFNIEDYSSAVRYLEQAYSQGKQKVLNCIIQATYLLEDYAATYQYASEANTYIGYFCMAALYENGYYVQKNRGKAYEYYSYAQQSPDVPKEMRSAIKEGMVRTYYGSSAHGNYIAKRLTIAVVGNLIIIFLIVILSMYN